VTADRYDPAAYWDALLGRDFSLRGVGHSNLPQSFNRLAYGVLRDAVRRTLRRATDGRGLGDAEVADIGFGTGAWLDFWREEGAATVAGFDLSRVAVERARTRYPNSEFFEADIAAAPLPTRRRFDIVSAMNVLLHVTDDARFGHAMRNVRRMLRDGGLFVAIDAVIAHRSWGPPFTADASSKARPLADWRAALDASGLELKAIGPATCLLGNPIDARWAATFRAWNRYWFTVGRLASGGETRGLVVGAPLAALDRGLIRVLRTGPSAKCLVARAGG
jgi:SAM-dependent methyltransferase